MGKFGKIADANTTVEAAYELYESKPELLVEFKEFMDQQGLTNATDTQAHWAYWFARMVISDRWPAGEDLIRRNAIASEAYDEVLALYRRLGTLGHTVGIPEPAETATAQREIPPPTKRKWLTGYEARAIADTVADNVAELRRERRQRILDEEDEDQLG